MSNRRTIAARLVAPPSKSMAQRAIAAATLARGTSIICNISPYSDDTLAALDIATALGATLLNEGNNVHITGNFHLQNPVLACRESALCVRLFSPIAALLGMPVEITGGGTLLSRPLTGLTATLRALGVAVSKGNSLPLTIHGPLKPSIITLDASNSSQLLSGLLMALPLASGNSDIMVENLVSHPYIAMTLEVQQAFGIAIENNNYTHFHLKGSQAYMPQTYTVEGDWSSAAFWLVAATIGGSITVKNLSVDSLQADKAILQVLRQVGAIVEWHNNELTVSSNVLNSFNFNASNCPDLFPPLVLLAAFCDGVSVIEGVNRLQGKESNRAEALIDAFGKMGVQIETTGNEMIIHGMPELHGASISSFHDHRIAMAAACAGLFASGEIVIDDTACVNKSYPEFWNDLKKVKQ